jgi:hypothetical protein
MKYLKWNEAKKINKLPLDKETMEDLILDIQEDGIDIRLSYAIDNGYDWLCFFDNGEIENVDRVGWMLEDELNEDERQISEEEINIFLDNGITVNVYLTDLLSDTNLILLMKNGEIYERRSGNIKFDIYSSKEEFKTKTGASLDDEYKGNASQALMNLFDEVDDGTKYEIEMVYIDSQFDNPLLNSILKRFESQRD